MHPREYLKRIMSRPDPEINLAEAALVIAQAEYPALDIASYLQRIDELAAQAAGQLPQQAVMTDRLNALNQCLFEEAGFQGDSEDYYDPRNSFLNDVMDRRRGIPITLSVIYIEVGQRLGLPLAGVSFPGHFLVKLPVHAGHIVFDPYAGGVSLSEEELEHKLVQFYARDERSAAMPALANVLVTADKRSIVARILRNLKGVYVQSETYEKALDVTEQLLLVNPENAGEWRDRGIIHERLECFRAARDDYHHYLALQPEAEDAARIRARLLVLAERCRLLH